MPRAQDRRVLKTKAQLRTALTGLLEKKPLQEITVKELCEACNINRGTFYLHYPDVRALLDEIVNELMAQFEDMLESFRPGEMLLRSGAQAGYRVTDAATPMRDIFHFVAQNADICRVLLCGLQETAFVDKVNQLVRERVLDEWAALVGKESRLGYDYVFSFFCGRLYWAFAAVAAAGHAPCAGRNGHGGGGHHHQGRAGPAIAAPGPAYPSL